MAIVRFPVILLPASEKERHARPTLVDKRKIIRLKSGAFSLILDVPSFRNWLGSNFGFPLDCGVTFTFAGSGGIYRIRSQFALISARPRNLVK